MKKLFTLAVLILCSLFLAPCSNAQGNLQFNQVINFQNDGNYTAGVTALSSPIYTVPPGKIWKIEYINLRRQGSTSSNTFQSSLIINGKIIFNDYNILTQVGGAFLNSEVKTPIWISSGSTIQTRTEGGNQNFVYSASFALSIIEFNVVP